MFCSSNIKDRDPFEQGHDRVKEHFLIFSFMYLLWNYFFQIYRGLGLRVMGVNESKMDHWMLMSRKLKEQIESSHLFTAFVSGQPGGGGWEEGLIWVFSSLMWFFLFLLILSQCHYVFIVLYHYPLPLLMLEKHWKFYKKKRFFVCVRVLAYLSTTLTGI